MWSFFGKDPSEAGTSIFFNEFHQAVGRQIFRGTSKLFRFARSTLHGSGSTAPTASPSVRSAVATPSRTSDAPASPAPSTAHNSHLLALPGIRLNGASPHSPSSYMTPSKSQSAPMLGGGRAPGSHVKIYPKHMCAEDHHYEQAFERRENHRLLRRQHHFVSESHGREARKKVEFIDPEMVAPSTTPTKADNDITSAVIEPLLLDPNGWTPSSSRAFTLLSVDEIHALCDKVTAILGNEDICVEVPAPAKVFGDIHGQIGDLLNFFTTFGSPNHFTGDIELVNYVFLGDYVDRGAHSVEVVVLLLSLKLRYPGQVFLLRGNHEDGEINAHYGFKAECVERFPHGEGEAVWHAFNAVFNWLPVAGVIQVRGCGGVQNWCMKWLVAVYICAPCRGCVCHGAITRHSLTHTQTHTHTITPNHTRSHIHTITHNHSQSHTITHDHTRSRTNPLFPPLAREKSSAATAAWARR